MYHASKVDQIYREAQALQKLSHPHIVKLYHAFLINHDVVLVMEYVAGGELYRLVKDSKTGLSEWQARELFRQLADAVEYCHARYVIHRDLKPTNILLTGAETPSIKVISVPRPQLIDFGIAGNNYGKSKDSSTAGSLPYMPPEVLTCVCTAADPAIDLWAMGIILYFLVTASLPFRGTLRTQRQAQTTRKSPRPSPRSKSPSPPVADDSATPVAS